MTYSTIESSISDGRPVELLEINYGGITWHYTTSEVAIVFGGQTYEPVPFSRDSIDAKADINKSDLNIKLPMDSAVGETFRVQPPSTIVSLTLFQQHVGDTDYVVVWKGRIVNIQWSPPWLEIKTESVFSSLQRVGLRKKYSIQCTASLYDPFDCKVDREAFRQNHVATAISGTTITCISMIGQPEKYFSGGYLTWISVNSGLEEKRMVRGFDNATGQLYLSALPLGLIVGETLAAYPGCDHLLATCQNKFNNSLNFAGTPFIPQKNPFGGSSIY